MKNDRAYLKHILDAIKLIENFTNRISDKKFFKDYLIQSASVRQLEIIGEAVKNLSPELKKEILMFHGKTLPGCVIN